MENTLTVGLADAPIRFACDYAPLLAYARAHLAPLTVEDDRPAAITASLRWHEGHPPADIVGTYPWVAGAERLDRDVYAAAGQLLWTRIDELRDLHVHFQWDGRQLRISADFYHRLSKKPRADRVRRLVFRRQLDALRRKRFTRLLYYLIYYPAFWWLEHLRDTHPIHAGAVAIGDAAVVLAGPSGVGKSTLTVGLSGAPGAKLMSDTFVLQRGTDIYAVPEPLLLDPWSRTWLGEAADTLTAIPDHEYVLGRDGYVLARQHLAASAVAAVLILPRRAPEPFARPLPAAEALARVDAYNDIVNDMRRYRAVAAVLELLGPSGLARARLASLEALVGAVPCYELGLTSAMSRAETVETILKLTGVTDVDRTRRAARQPS